MNIFELENVSFIYPQSEKPTLHNVSLSIKEGEYCAIVGSNGSGKSTLCRLLANLDLPSSGKINAKKDSLIALIFQSPKNQIICSIVSRDTAFGPQNLGLPKSEVELRTIECLNIVDLLEKAKASTLNLSLGQTQKLALSGVLATWPSVIILDEAVVMLDPVSRKNVFEFLNYWNRHGNTVIHITHELDAIKQTNHVIALSNGEVFFDGNTKDYLANNEYIQKLLGQPLPICDRTKQNILMAEKDFSFGFSNVSFSYENEKYSCLHNVSFKLRKGTLTALTGPSGSGKSTLLEIGSGLLSAKKGCVFGQKHASLALQNCSDAVFETFCADDVAFGPKNLGLKGKELKERVKNAMDSVNLSFERYADIPVRFLSGGELRRLAIASIIAMDNPVMFFDEPSAGLDGQSRQEVMLLLQNLARQGKTILFSTHNMQEASFADRQIGIEKGLIVSDSFAPVIKPKLREQEDALEMGEAEEASQSQTEKNALEPPSITQKLSSLRALSNSLSGAKEDKKSLVSKLPSFIRILLFSLMFVLCLVSKNVIFCSIMFALSVVYCLLSGFSAKALLRSFIKITPFLLLFALFQLIFRRPLQDEPLYLSFKWFSISPSKLLFCLCSFLRTFAALSCVCAFYNSLRDYELIDGLRVIFYPLEKIKLPMRYLYLLLEIIFRFIPLLVDQTCAILKTQAIRGGMLNTKGKIETIKRFVPLIVPIIIQTIKRSEALADAITVRYFK